MGFIWEDSMWEWNPWYKDQWVSKEQKEPVILENVSTAPPVDDGFCHRCHSYHPKEQECMMPRR